MMCVSGGDHASNVDLDLSNNVVSKSLSLMFPTPVVQQVRVCVVVVMTTHSLIVFVVVVMTTRTLPD